MLGKPSPETVVYKDALSALDENKSYSYIRCGDGEGHFLQFLTDDASIQTISWRLNFFFGTQDIKLCDIRKISSDMRDAIHACTRLGINQRYSYEDICAKSNIMPSDANGFSGLKLLYDYIKGQDFSGKLTSAHHPYSMVLNGELYKLIHKASKVIVVTGRKSLSNYMSIIFGDKVWPIFLDEEHNFSNYSAVKTAKLGVLLDELDRQVDECAAPGVLFLVGAGPVGKGLCGRAARKGAVVIDCGAMFDAMVGLNTRDYFSNDKKWPQDKVLDECSPLLLTSKNVELNTNGAVNSIGIVTSKLVSDAAVEYWRNANDDDVLDVSLTYAQLLERYRRQWQEIKNIKMSRTYRALMRINRLRRMLLGI